MKYVYINLFNGSQVYLLLFDILDNSVGSCGFVLYNIKAVKSPINTQ